MLQPCRRDWAAMRTFSSTLAFGRMLVIWYERAMPLLRDAVGRQPGDVLAVEQDAPRGRTQDAGQAIEERALAGAVGADDGADLAALHGEIDAD